MLITLVAIINPKREGAVEAGRAGVMMNESHSAIIPAWISVGMTAS